MPHGPHVPSGSSGGDGCPRETENSSGSTRRKFMNLLLGGGLLSTVGAVLVPIINFVMPPKVQEAIQNSVVAARVGELAPNSGKVFRFGNEPGILILKPNGEYAAFSAVCTHLQCTVQYRDDFKHIWCACHNGHFDLTGKNLSGPPPRPLEAFQVEVRDEEVIVTRGS